MRRLEVLVNALFRILFRVFFRLNLEVFEQVPTSGPYIIIINHPSVFEGPLMYTFLQPRRIVALAKKNIWSRKSVGWIMRLWRAIPVDDFGLSRESMEKCFSVLDQGHFLALAPEGVKTNTGNLQQGKPGMAYIAFKKQVPIIPLATIGFENFGHYFKRLRRTPVTIVVGKPFEIIQKDGRLSPNMRQELVDEMMMRLAMLMPRTNWGHYSHKNLEFTYTRELD